MLSFLSGLLSKLKPAPKSEPKPTPAPKVEPQTSNDALTDKVLYRLSYDTKKSFTAAVIQFQKDQGLVGDGKLGPKTMARVRFYDEKLKLAPENMKRMRRWRATHYYIAEESDYAKVGHIPVYDRDKKVLSSVPAAFFCNSALEGTGKLLNGKLINVAGKNYVTVDPTVYAPAAEVYKKHIAYMQSKRRTPRPSRYFGVDYVDGKVVRAQPFQIVEKQGLGFGIGKKGIPHETNKTIATDQGLYGTSEPRFKGKGGLWPAGTRGWIIDAAGENGHDGWVVAADVGGGIFGAHLDLFTGTKEHLHDLPIRSNAITYVWFDGLEDRVPADYDYGLIDRK